jgi:hypothetical protein
MAIARINEGARLRDALVLRRGANSLNFLRLVLASMVIVSHCSGIGGFGPQQILGNQTLGSLAVDGFFGISGFLIWALPGSPWVVVRPDQAVGGKMLSCVTPSSTVSCWVSSPRGR